MYASLGTPRTFYFPFALFPNYRYQRPRSRGETRLRCVASRESSFRAQRGCCIINPLTSTLFTSARTRHRANWVERIRLRQFSHPRLAERNFNGYRIAARRARLSSCTFDFFARRSATSTPDIVCNSKRLSPTITSTYDFHFVTSRHVEVCRDIFSLLPLATSIINPL